MFQSIMRNSEDAIQNSVRLAHDSQLRLASFFAFGFGPRFRGRSVCPGNAWSLCTNDRPPSGRPVTSWRCIASGKSSAVEPSR